ncbi:hypothetical protein KR759_13290, partial [Staphylococcus aureus]|uniref:hypothetical protein n=1 Tax=Staphylococcus aureus TaxID=1280 RepID=UPI001C1FD8E0
MTFRTLDFDGKPKHHTGLGTIPAKIVLLVVVIRTEQNFRNTYLLRQGVCFFIGNKMFVMLA